MITLRHGPFELVLTPAIGGSVQAFRAHGRDVLRPAAQAAAAEPGPLEMAAFPLIPFAGRIAFGRFELGGTRVELPPNFPPEPHAIHGQTWQMPWAVDDARPTRATLTCRHPADAWPWSYQARQRFELDERGLSLELALKNVDDRRMPAGLGWHPYFPRQGASLSADVDGRWGFEPATLAPRRDARPAEPGLRALRAVTDLVLDDVYGAGPGGARLIWPHRQITLTGSDAFGFLVVYVPSGGVHFCVEPISHVPNALNSRLPAKVTGLRVLEPGEELSGVIRLQVQPAT